MSSRHTTRPLVGLMRIPDLWIAGIRPPCSTGQVLVISLRAEQQGCEGFFPLLSLPTGVLLLDKAVVSWGSISSIRVVERKDISGRIERINYPFLIYLFCFCCSWERHTCDRVEMAS